MVATPKSGSTAIAPAEVVELKVAHLGLIGTLIGALIAAIIGSGVAGYFALANTTKTQSGETDRSRAEFLRGQQREAYQTVAAQATAVDNAETELMLALGNGNKDRASKVTLEKRENLEAARTKLYTERFDLAIVGSNRVVPLFDALLNDHHGQYIRLLALEGADRKDWPNKYLECVNGLGAIKKSEEDLLIAARQDMGL